MNKLEAFPSSAPEQGVEARAEKMAIYEQALIKLHEAATRMVDAAAALKPESRKITETPEGDLNVRTGGMDLQHPFAFKGSIAKHYFFGRSGFEKINQAIDREVVALMRQIEEELGTEAKEEMYKRLDQHFGQE